MTTLLLSTFKSPLMALVPSASTAVLIRALAALAVVTAFDAFVLAVLAVATAEAASVED